MNESKARNPAPGTGIEADSVDKLYFGISESAWRLMILVSSATVLLISVYCLSTGITTIFMHLYYFPIVLVAYRYRMRGILPAVLLALSYPALVLFYDVGQTGVLVGALLRCAVFVGIAAVIAYLSEWLFASRQSLSESSELHERYLSFAPAIILVLDSAGAIVLLNRYGCAVLGCSFEGVKGRSWIDTFIREDQRDDLSTIFEELIEGKTGLHQVVEHEVIPLQGPARIVRWHNTLLRDDAGAVTGTLSYGEDVTEEKQAEDTIRELQQFQESVIKNANVWITVLSTNGTILLWNDAAEAISGYKRDDLLGSNAIWKKLYPETGYRETVTRDIRRIIERDNYLENFETRIRCADGSVKTIAWNTRGLRGATGDVMSFIAIGRDITGLKQVETDLQESEKLLNEVGFMAHVGGWELDVATKQVRWTKETYHIHDVSEDDMVDLPKAILFFDMPERSLLEEALRHCMEDGEPFDLELPFTSAKGRHLWTRSIGRPVVAEGRVVRLRGTFQDITGQKKTADALKASEEAYRDLVENLNDIVYTVDDKGDVTYTNAAVKTILGYTPDEIRGLNITKIIHPDDLAAEMRRIGEIKRGIIKPSDWRAVTKDGEIRWVRSVSQAIFRDGQYAGLHGIVSDVSERKLAEEALRESENKFREIFDKANDGIEIIEIREDGYPGRYIDVNEVACRMLQYSKEEMLQHSPLDFHAEWSRAELAGPVSDLQTSGHSTFETEHIRKDGTIVPVEINSHIVTLLGKQVLLSLVRDITLRKKTEEALRQSEYLYRTLAESSPESIFILSLEGRFTYINKYGCSIIGRKQEDIVGRPLSDVFPPQAIAHQMDQITTIVKTGSPLRDSTAIVPGPSGLRPFDTWLVPLKSPQGEVTSILGISRDITDLKEKEEALLESRQILEGILNTIPVRVFWKDKNLNFLGCNTAFARDAGFEKPEDIIGKDDYAMGWHEQADLYRSDDREVMESGNPKMLIEEPQTTPDGRTISLLTSKLPLRDRQGEVIGVLGAYQDITGLKEAEEALREIENRNARLLDAIPDMMFIMSRTGEYLEFRVPDTSSLAIPADQIIGSNIHDTGFDEKTADMIMQYIEEALGTKQLQLFEYELNIPSGIRDYEARMVALSEEEVLGIVRDITDRKRAEEALVLVNKKLNMLNSITRHDILNKLMGLRAYLELIRGEIRDPGVLEYILNMEQASEAIQRQIEFTRNYQDIGTQVPQWQPLSEIIDSAVQQVHPPKVAVHIAIAGTEVYADPLIEKVFYNLMENSIRHGVHVTRMDFSMQETGEGLIVAYNDDGVGISEEDKKKLFQKGFGRHSGLGLFLSKEILSITGITITENGIPGKGVRFEILVPKGMYRFGGIPTNG